MLCHYCNYVFVPPPFDVHFDATLCGRCRNFIIARPPDWHDIRPYQNRRRIVPEDDCMPEYLLDYLKLTGHC